MKNMKTMTFILALLISNSLSANSKDVERIDPRLYSDPTIVGLLNIVDGNSEQMASSYSNMSLAQKTLTIHLLKQGDLLLNESCNSIPEKSEKITTDPRLHSDNNVVQILSQVRNIDFAIVNTYRAMNQLQKSLILNLLQKGNLMLQSSCNE